ncbi:hypothetical protein HRI_002574600 [Hibiscus trionum]|uniref:Uncharacterized protein n=1 Tax=Hibiscus trionum TaxID=183268 RepID=A0A9W7I4Y2_HIBTR|nr:hypothetical protein HRI_002574600 [Hibiscus trionum]
MEIAEEDNDSLLLQLQQTLTDAVSTFDPSFFSCSPLHFPTSNPTDVKAQNPSFSSNINKENIDNTEHKSELQKLSLEPQTMKRKKKGGCYNLRKSLAWDRAFFTEEGVLNSTELSLITGNFSKLSGEKLLAIEEEPGGSLSSDSPDLQALENNLFKELPCNNINTKEANKIAISSLRQKSSASASCSMLKQNVLSVHDVNRSGSKRGGCPRPVIPANVSTTKAAVKEPKIFKLPAPKSGSSTARSSPNLNKPKRNQSVQAAVSAHRSIGLTGSNKSTRSTQNDAKSSLSSRSQINKLSAIQPKRNVKSSPLASHSSAQSQHPLVTKPDNGLKVNQDLVVASGHVSINNEAVSNKIASLPQSHCHIGGNTQYSHPQMTKPSGLRMPSPSLGFFTQSKTIASHNVQSSTKTCNNPKSYIPIFSKLGVLNSTFEISTPKKVHVVASDVAAIKNSRTPSTESSVPSSASSLCKDFRPNSRDDKLRRVEEVSCNSYNHELTNYQQQLHTIDGLKPQTDHAEFQCSDNKLHLQSQSSEQVKLDCKRENLVIPRSPDHIGGEFKDPHFVPHHGLLVKSGLKADDAGNQLSGNVQNNSMTEDFDLFPKLHSCDVHSSNIHGSPIVNIDQISIHHSHEHSSKPAETEQVKPCTFEDDQKTNEIQRQHINDGSLLKEVEPSEEFLSLNRIHRNDGTVGAIDFNQQSHVADAQKQSLECKLPLESSSYLLNVSEADNLLAHVNGVNKKLAEQPPIPDPCIVVETAFQDDYGSHSNDCLLHGEIFSSDNFARQNELANSNAPCRIPSALQNCVHEMAEVVECLNAENEASVCTDTQCNHDNQLLYEATPSKGLERIEEDQETGAITACDIGVSNDCQRSGNWDARQMDDSNSISPLGLVDAISEPGEKIKFCHFNAPGMLTNSLMDKQDDCEAIAQDELIQSSLKAGNAFLDNPILETCHGLFSVERKFLVESQNFDSDNCAGVGPRNKGSFIQAVEGPSDMSHVRTDEPSKKCAAGDNEMTNGSFSKDACLLSFNDGISFDSCKVILFTSAENNNNFAVVENLNKPQELQNSVSAMPERGKFGLSVTEEISTYVKINLSDNNSDGCNDAIMPDYKQSGQVTSLNVGFTSLSKDQVSGAENTCKSQAFCSLTEESTSSIKTNRISSNGSFLGEEVNRLENDVPQELHGSVTHVEATGSTSLVEETGNDRKHVSPLVKPPLKAVPFSDEWLAAFEAAGEEILTMKSGAVQNSPKDKSLPEPGPWSPVRKKNNQGVGPFDCTKYTNTNVPPSFE